VLGQFLMSPVAVNLGADHRSDVSEIPVTAIYEFHLSHFTSPAATARFAVFQVRPSIETEAHNMASLIDLHEMAVIVKCDSCLVVIEDDRHLGI
jgi:hypothetical protein